MATTKKAPPSTEPDTPLFDENGYPIRYATITEVARRLGVNRRWVERAMRRYDEGWPTGEKLRFARFGRLRRMSPADLAALLELDREEAA